jgi:hypothetical protein
MIVFRGDKQLLRLANKISPVLAPAKVSDEGLTARQRLNNISVKESDHQK